MYEITEQKVNCEECRSYKVLSNQYGVCENEAHAPVNMQNERNLILPDKLRVCSGYSE